MKVSVQAEDFDLGFEVKALSKDPKIGAVASFVGVVRDVAMTLEHYPGMTQGAIAKIVEEARSRWKLMGCTVIHRYGELKPNDQIVMVAVAAAHRGEAFAACEFIMDYLKTRAPFWKKEHRAEGARWVEARSSDDDAAQRWGSEDATEGPKQSSARRRGPI
jgi:molybdopterin synthase catalytic subunit